jgi:hypothetical protein
MTAKEIHEYKKRTVQVKVYTQIFEAQVISTNGDKWSALSFSFIKARNWVERLLDTTLKGKDVQSIRIYPRGVI